MSKFFTNINPELNLFKKPSVKSEVVTQIIYGESFKILKKSKNFFLIKIKEDGYVGFIKKIKLIDHIRPNFKVSTLYANVYKNPKNKKIISKLPFAAKIKVEQTSAKFAKFSKGWIEYKNIKPINHKDKDIFKNVKIFKNIKYKWGGRTFNGIDCSALIQVCLQYNNKYCPRDSGQQIKFFKKNINLKKINKNDIIYWKGHVALALSKNNLIHAYGPRKKTVIMDIKKTIKLIEKTAHLKVLSIKRLK